MKRAAEKQVKSYVGMLGALNIAKHEQRHQKGDFVKALRRTNEFLKRSDSALLVPVETILGLQDAGLPLHRIAAVLECSWAGLLRLTKSDTDTVRKDIHQFHLRAAEMILDALKTAIVARPLVEDEECLCAAVQCAWKYHSNSEQTFGTSLVVSAYFMEHLRFTPQELVRLYRHTGALGALSPRISLLAQELNKHEVLALAQRHTILTALSSAEFEQLIAALREYRGRVPSDVLLQSVQSVGLHAACALHEVTTATETVVRANAVRQQYGMSIAEYLLVFGAIRETGDMDFEVFVQLTEHWHPRDVRTACTVYPDTKRLLELRREGLHHTLAAFHECNAPQESLAKFGLALLRFLQHKPKSDIVRATWAFSVCKGNVRHASNYLALPVQLQHNPAVPQIVQQHPELLTDAVLLQHAVPLAASGATIDVVLLQKLVEHGGWRSARHATVVYQLAQHFLATIATDPADAVVRAAFEYHELTPRQRARCIRSRGHFRSIVIRSTPPLQGHALVSSTASVAAAQPKSRRQQQPSMDPRTKYLLRRGNTAPNSDETAETTDEGDGKIVEHTRDISIAHKRLDLSDLVPAGVNAEDASAVVIHGFFELGKGVVFADSRYLPDRHALRNVRARYADPALGSTHAAWRWLERIGIIHHPTHKGGAQVISLALRDSAHRDASAREVARRIRAFIHAYRADAFTRT